jgi:hypothetical protein
MILGVTRRSCKEVKRRKKLNWLGNLLIFSNKQAARRADRGAKLFQVLTERALDAQITRTFLETRIGKNFGFPSKNLPEIG